MSEVTGQERSSSRREPSADVAGAIRDVVATVPSRRGAKADIPNAGERFTKAGSQMSNVVALSHHAAPADDDLSVSNRSHVRASVRTPTSAPDLSALSFFPSSKRIVESRASLSSRGSDFRYVSHSFRNAAIVGSIDPDCGIHTAVVKMDARIIPLSLLPSLGEKSSMSVATNIRALLEERKMSANALSVAAGLNRDTVGQILKGRGANPRSDTIAKLANALGVEPAALLSGEAAGRPAIRAAEILLPVRYSVAAGVWLEAQDYLGQAEPNLVPVRQIPRYAGVDQWLERVAGDNLDRFAPPGSLVHVVDVGQFDYQPQHCDIVVVERSRAGATLFERSLRWLSVIGGEILLRNHSHNPRWGAPIPLTANQSGADETVRIVGLAIQSIMPLDQRE